ncbi:uncharacterized protein KQ657_002958 [Scheffersomyces spartinae]|uniref:Uncharacterized protein n=1 Tax=Scheffersomyces spartinae TaxID=45513 RepID=A0A9P7V5K3_9ASCO|nr:uncharacterized protein KQ657_002958 [Scheffersomyces spartinae]KAG7191566.1 hypothetical protein KQ657_002958 [Scheffersomyces spartinae]
MALQFKKGNRNMKFALTSGAIIVGGVFLILKSYPHVKAALFSKGTSTTVSEADDSTPVELNKEDSEDEVVPELILNESLVNIELMSEDELKKWLSEKEINPPSDASHSNLVSLVKSIQETST